MQERGLWCQTYNWSRHASILGFKKRPIRIKLERDLYMWEETCERDLLTREHTMTGSIWSALTTVVSDCLFEVISAAVDKPQFPGAQFTIQLPRGKKNDHCSMLLLFLHIKYSSSPAGSSICSKRGLRGTSNSVCHIFRRKPIWMSRWLPIISKDQSPPRDSNICTGEHTTYLPYCKVC